jgi:hypothetical protein
MSLERIAAFVPRSERVKLFKTLYLMCNSNAADTAKLLGINVRQVYFYLPNHKGKFRNHPNDKTTYLILRALFKKNPKVALGALNSLSNELSNLLKEIDVDGAET